MKISSNLLKVIFKTKQRVKDLIQGQRLASLPTDTLINLKHDVDYLYFFYEKYDNLRNDIQHILNKRKSK